jgi:drug/metabolite transporter (DMT)-like permease
LSTATAAVRAPVAASLKGILVMVIGCGVLTLSDAVSKHLTLTYPVGQIVCLRHVAALFVIVPYGCFVTGRAALVPHNHRDLFVRGLMFTATACLIVLGVKLLPLATAASIAFASPIFVALLSMQVLGERVTRAMWIGILVGFAGVLVMLRPGAASFEWALLVPVGAAIASAGRDLWSRKLARTDSSIGILLWSSIVVILVSALSAFWGWTMPDATGVAWLVLLGVLNAVAHFMMIEGFRLGEASVIAPFKYSGLLWAALIGFLAWGDVPDGWTIAGALLILAGGLQLARHDKK